MVTRFQVLGANRTFTSNGSIITYTDCIPGDSQLNIEGRSLFDVSVTVGGIAYNFGPFTYAYTNQLQCNLDDGDVLTSDTFYDVVVATDEGQVTISQAVAFTSQPTLVRVLPCWDDGGFYPRFGSPVPRCMAGDTLTIIGRRLVRSELQLTSASFRTFYAPPTPYLNCSTPTITSDTVLMCVMPPNTDVDCVMRTASLTSLWGGYAGNAFNTYPYDYLDAPASCPSRAAA